MNVLSFPSKIKVILLFAFVYLAVGVIIDVVFLGMAIQDIQWLSSTLNALVVSAVCITIILYSSSGMVSFLGGKVNPPDFRTDESPVIDTASNLMHSRWQSIGGKLFLTNKALYFRAHPFNLKRPNLNIELSEVLNFSPAKVSSTIDNGLIVETKDGTYTFVLNSRNEFTNLLKDHCKNIQNV